MWNIWNGFCRLLHVGLCKERQVGKGTVTKREWHVCVCEDKILPLREKKFELSTETGGIPEFSGNSLCFCSRLPFSVSVEHLWQYRQQLLLLVSAVRQYEAMIGDGWGVIAMVHHRRRVSRKRHSWECFWELLQSVSVQVLHSKDPAFSVKVYKITVFLPLSYCNISQSLSLSATQCLSFSCYLSLICRFSFLSPFLSRGDSGISDS